MLRLKHFIPFLAILVLPAFLGCEEGTPTSPGGPGKLSITLSLKSAMDAGANITRVSVSISRGTYADSMDLVISGESASGTFTNLLIGAYAISVKIYDGTTLIGTGSGEATIAIGEPSTVRITVTFFSGDLEVIVDWNNPPMKTEVSRTEITESHKR